MRYPLFRALDLAVASLFALCMLSGPSTSARAAPVGPATSSEQRGGDADRLYRYAMALADRGDFERASSELRTFVEKFPPSLDRDDKRRTEAGFWLGYCLHKAKKHDEAARVLAEWTSANPKHKFTDRAHHWRAESLAAAGRPTEARLEWREVVSRFPNSPRAANALESLAWSHFDGGEYERALERAREIGERFPGRKDIVDKATHLAGECLLALGRGESAVAEFDSLLASAPAKDLEVKARHGRAAALQDCGRHEEAARAYAEVTRLAEAEPTMKTKVPALMLEHASALVSAGRAETAPLAAAGREEEARRASARWADEALKVLQLLQCRSDRGAAGLKAGFWWGLAFEAKGQAADASAAYEQVLSRPEAGSVHGRAAWQLADIRYREGDLLGAVAAYDRVVALGDPPGVVDESLYNSAVALDELGKTGDALSRVDSLLADHPESQRRADALYAAGDFLVRLERFGEAAARYGEFLLRFPTDERAGDVRFRRGWCLNASGAADAARAELERLLRTEPTGEHAAEAAFLLGESARKDGRLDEAARAYEKVLEADPRSARAAEALFELSSIAHGAGRAKEAEGYARRLVKEHPDSPLVPLAEIRAADVALADGRTDEALAGYRSVRARWPGHELEPAALSGEAWALLNSGDKPEALAAFRSLAEAHPESRFGIEALYRSAVLLREEGRSAEAEAALAELLRRNPDGRFTQAAVFEQALARRSAGDVDGAISDLVEFERNFPESRLLPEVLRELALANYDKRDSDAERATWRRILGALAESAGDCEAAAREYGLAVASAAEEAPPEAAGAALRRAECLARLGRKSEAWSAFCEVADAFSTSDEAPRALVRAGDLAMEGGDHAGAIPLLRRAERLAPGTGAVLLAKALREGGRRREALVVIEKHLETAKPEGLELRRAKLELALTKRAFGSDDEAAAGLREVAEGGDDALAARAQYELGEIHFKAKRYREADRAFYQLVLLYPFREWQAKGRFRLGETNELLQDYARARAFYAELVRENPKSALVPQARERLGALGP